MMIKQTYRRTIEPALEPVTVDEAKMHLRVDEANEDDYIETLITASRQWCEDYTRRSFINTTWTMKQDRFPCGAIELTWPRVQSITSVAYADSSGEAQVISPSGYTLDQSEPARLLPAMNTYWPTTRGDVNDVTVTFISGYGSTAVSVPAGIKHAIKLMVSHFYENREPVNIGNIVNEIPLTVQSLLNFHRWELR